MLNFKVSSIKTMPRSPQTEALVQQHLATKVAASNPNTALNANAVTEAMIDKYRAEYQDFLKNLENMDFSAMFAQPKAEEKKEETLPEAVHEEAYQAFVKEDEKTPDLVNGISVGEEAGDTVVIASTKKTRKKKAAEDETETA